MMLIIAHKTRRTKMAREDFLKYCASYSGIDGGDIDAEYWFICMEWSDINDIKDDYSFIYDKWLKIEEIPDHIDIKTKPDDWKLENKLDILYHKLMSEFVGGKTIFEKASNTLKLNLLPLPFLNNDAKNMWDKTRLEETTGFSSFNEYAGKESNNKKYAYSELKELYKDTVLPARKLLFKNLLRKSPQLKTIFCFGKAYKNKFLYALTDEFEVESIKPEKELSYSSVCVYNMNKSTGIKRILLCPFPYTPGNEFTDKDWQIICDLAKE